MEELKNLLSKIIGSKYDSASDKNIVNDKARLQNLLGQKTSDKVMDNIMAFNSEGNTSGAWKDKLQSFINNSGDPNDPKYKDNYYEANATLAFFKDKLNEKLKAKNPEAFKDYFQGLSQLRRSGDTTGALKYVQDSPYNEYLTPQEVQQTLGKDDYQKYLNALQSVNNYNISQKQQPLYGGIEGEQDINNLNYGRRFASLQVTPSVSIHNKTTGTDYSRMYTYDPKSGQVVSTESGDIKSRPDYLMPK